jgi:hypothetical protein
LSSYSMKKATTQARPSARPAPSPRGAPLPTVASPPFGRIITAAFRSVGIEYVALDHLRKAKKNALDAVRSLSLRGSIKWVDTHSFRCAILYPA